MKKITLLVLALFFSYQGFSQNPDLFQTWHLYKMEFESGDIYIVEGWDPYLGNPSIPQIMPSLSIANDLSFTGEGICNTFEGTFEVPSGDCFPIVLTFSNTANSCGLYENDFETRYFTFFAPNAASVCYNITNDSDGFQTLFLGGSIFTGFTFRNTPILDIPDFGKDVFKLYPNPALETLFISSEGISITNYTIYTIKGEQILSEEGNISSINVSGLAEGMYFLEIFSEEGKSMQKFLKK